MATPPPSAGRPRTRSREEPRQYVGGQIPARLKRLLEGAAKANGRSLNAEFVSQLEQSLGNAIYPPEIAALLELLGRAMLDAGTSISNANRYSGHGGVAPWVDDGFAWDQAIRSAIRVLLKSRHKAGRRPHGLFAGADYPTELACQIGKQVADGILAVMFGEHKDDGSTASLWAPRVREKLGVIGDRLAHHAPPGEYFVVTSEPLTSVESPACTTSQERNEPGSSAADKPERDEP